MITVQSNAGKPGPEVLIAVEQYPALLPLTPVQII